MKSMEVRVFVKKNEPLAWSEAHGIIEKDIGMVAQQNSDSDPYLQREKREKGKLEKRKMRGRE